MNEKLPIGTKVRYHGSVLVREGGEYTIAGYSDLSRRGDLTLEQIESHWPEGIAYDLWPVGVPKKFGNRDRAMYYVRRQSFTVVEES